MALHVFPFFFNISSTQGSNVDAMMESLHVEQNQNRTRPCFQSAKDTFRLLYYDVLTASEFSDHAQPMLIRRHNVVPGMFLVRVESWYNIALANRSDHSHNHGNLYPNTIIDLCIQPYIQSTIRFLPRHSTKLMC